VYKLEKYLYDKKISEKLEKYLYDKKFCKSISAILGAEFFLNE